MPEAVAIEVCLREAESATKDALHMMESAAFEVADTLALGQLLEAQRITLAASASLRAIAQRLGFTV